MKHAAIGQVLVILAWMVCFPAHAQNAAQRAALAHLGRAQSRVHANGAPGGGAEAVDVSLDAPRGVAFDAAGNLYIADTDNHVVRKVTVQGIITTVAGTGEQGFGGDGGAPTAALLDSPSGVAVDAHDFIYIADTHNNRIRKVSGGIIATIAGTGAAGYSGDGGPAVSAVLDHPSAVTFDSAGHIYIADTGNHRIREIVANNISTVAGDGEQFYAGDGGAATAAGLDSPNGIAVDSAFNLYIGDTHNQRVRMVTFATGNIATLAGTGAKGFSGDGTATTEEMANPRGVAVDGAGTVYVADSDNNRIRTVSGGALATIAGNGEEGYSGDAGPAVSAALDGPHAVALSGSEVAFADTHNNAVRAINGGTVNTIAGRSASESLVLSGASMAPYGAVGSLVATFSNGGNTATGLVTFFDGQGASPAMIGSASLSGNVAALNTASLAAGTHYITATYGGDANNAPAASGVFVFVVAPARLTYTAFSYTRTYGAALPGTLSYSIVGFVNGDSASTATTGSPTIGTAAVQGSPVGSYPITISIGSLASTNYSFQFVAGTMDVTKATLTVAALNYSRYFEAALPSSFAYSITGFVNGDSAGTAVTGAPSITTTAVVGSPDGSYPITPTIGTLAAANYAFQFQAGTLTITSPAVLTVTPFSYTRTYGSALPSPLQYAITGFVNGDTQSVVSGAPVVGTTATSSSPVGAYPITATMGTLSASNYTFQFAPGTLTITPAALKVTAFSYTRTYGSAPPSPAQYSITGFVNGDTQSVVSGAPSITTSATSSSPVGSYAITPAIGTLSTTGNYTFQFQAGSLTITAASLKVSALNYTRAYGAALPSPLAYTITGFVNGETQSVVSGAPSVTTTAVQGSPVGGYPITPAAGSLSASNYTFTFSNGTLTIAPAVLTVTAFNYTRAQGAALPSPFAYSITGFVNGETQSVVSGAPSITTTAVQGSPAGMYPITPTAGSLSAPNYSFGFADGTLTITP
jgi:sugar lactone lactonase YvrE